MGATPGILLWILMTTYLMNMETLTCVLPGKQGPGNGSQISVGSPSREGSHLPFSRNAQCRIAKPEKVLEYGSETQEESKVKSSIPLRRV